MESVSMARRRFALVSQKWSILYKSSSLKGKGALMISVQFSWIVFYGKRLLIELGLKYFYTHTEKICLALNGIYIPAGYDLRLHKEVFVVISNVMTNNDICGNRCKWEERTPSFL